MPAPKSERLLNLLIMLLVQRRPIGKDRIRELLYPDSRPDAFEKMFERDKDELRSLGVPVEVATIDPLFEDEVGYRIPPEAFALPSIDLTAEEAAVVGIAARVWQHATMAQVTSEAVRKLSAAGIDVDLGALDIAQPVLTAEEPGFEACWRAACERMVIEFDYRRPGADSAMRRHVQPWGVVRSSGRWYVVGYDTDRGAERVFRLSRVEGDVHAVGTPRAFEIPPDTDIREIARRLAPPTVPERVVLLVRSGAGESLRRTAEQVATDVTGPDGSAGWDRLEVERAPVGILDDVLSHGPDVVVLEPASLRARVVARLEGALAGALR
ncbi:helix-turn-helix transcriptional regulator [Nocardioides caeni]|uniref:WYL domain-containing protein n=1 Tax=Nocardioides caeni TaxID=574700 RepID=A0A4S8N1X7_9ACTN|nr:WYL domain-containing protein [Nocardioides caeni]THV09401.1 WYL domain-containing protein [Nocardioides caeni]